MTYKNLEFNKNISDKLIYYVYRLIDPRNGETFYVGKGKGNRIFSHINGVLLEENTDLLSEKMSRIHSIHLAGLEVGHVIHRHGLDEKTAFEVEAALIDAYPGVTNIMDGHGSSEYGVMHASEIIKKYSAEEVLFNHKALLISVNKSVEASSLYEATRYAWRLNVSKARKAEIILPIVQGLVVGVFIADDWLPATSENFPGRETIEGRFGFRGRKAPEDVHNYYMNKLIPDSFRKKGASNPIRYTW